MRHDGLENRTAAPDVSPRPDRIKVVVQMVCRAAPTIKILTVADAGGRDLPVFASGAHVDVVLKSGLVRQYSLCGPLAGRDIYQLAVKRDDHGRGGSKEIHETVREGDILYISPPRNHFPLKAFTGPRILLAGGIGITPIWSMVQQLRRDESPFFLYYSIRSRQDAIFLPEIEALALAGHAAIHVDDEAGQRFLDLDRVLGTFSGPRHVYCCGPAPLMAALRQRAAACGEAEVFFESFGVPAAAPPVVSLGDGGRDEEDIEFHVGVRSIGERIPVRRDESILEALEARGLPVESSCRAGTCGTCRAGYVGGDVLHLDYVLSDEEREAYMMLCVSRGVGDIELDL